LIYPTDGVPINDSTLAFIDHYNGTKKKDNYLLLQQYLRSKEGQDKLESLGRRTWYGGVNSNANKDYFKKDWGIDTEEYLTGTKFPSREVITLAINKYIEELRKPSHTVFCLDYSGSMYGEGIDDLRKAMNYILDYEQAGKDQLQFSKKDKITVLPFSSYVLNEWNTDNGKETQKLINNINNKSPSGGTAIYDCSITGLNLLSNESDDYLKTVILMTDGANNTGSFTSLERKYKSINEEIPIYSITFGSARESELRDIAKLTNAKVFDGRTNLLEAFKEVRGYF
jgi:Ca-activated chloride channel family protein